MNALSPIGRAPSLEATGMTKIFGPLVALDDVSISVPAGSFHALLGENGAGKSTLVKSIMGFYAPDKGSVKLDGKDVVIKTPKDARANGIGMVYQHFTLVPCLTAAENLVISRADAPAVIDWRSEKEALAAFMDTMPFKVPLDAQVATLSAGEKQKLEILKLLYLDQRFMILDEPTSVLTPGEADEMLGMLGDMAVKKEITVLMISHKFREVKAFCDGFSVLRRGKLTGTGDAQSASIAEMNRMMIGDTEVRERAARTQHNDKREVLELAGIFAEGTPVLSSINLRVNAGEIVGIAGVSGNGQSALVEVLAGQRTMSDGAIRIQAQNFSPKRNSFDRYKVFGLPEEPLKNATVPRMSVAENLAFRAFDKAPVAKFGWWMSPGPLRKRAEELIAQYRVKPLRPMPRSKRSRAAMYKGRSWRVNSPAMSMC